MSHDPTEIEMSSDNGYGDTLQKASSTDFMEIGSSGLYQNGGRVQEDFLRQLQGKQGFANFREMADNDPVIGGVLHAIDMMMRGVDWSVEPTDPNDEAAIDWAEFVASCMQDMSMSWQDTLSAVLTMLPYGFSYHEVVYKQRMGYSDDGAQRSKFDDGRIGWRKLPIRSQETIERWDLDEHGGIGGAWQSDPNAYGAEHVFLPIERCLLFRTTTKLNNPRGRSVLRNAFVPWYYKKRIQEIEAIGIERDLAGMPVALVPPQLLSNNATSEETAALNEIKKIVRNIKRDEQEGIVYPLAYDPETKQPAYDLKLLSTGGRRQFDTNAIIGRYDQRIAMTVLADFILLGHEQRGTQALSVSKISLFLDSLTAWLEGITGIFNSHAIPRLMRINGADERFTPTLTFSPPQSIDIDVIGDYVHKIAGSGGELFPNEDLQNYLLGIAGLPTVQAEEV